jgi:6-phosphogluconolactonase (cycloisomerase 2 family)
VSASGDDVDAGNSCTAFPPLANPQSLALSPDGRFLYAGNAAAGVGLAIFAVGPTGTLTPLASPLKARSS